MSEQKLVRKDYSFVTFVSLREKNPLSPEEIKSLVDGSSLLPRAPQYTETFGFPPKKNTLYLFKVGGDNPTIMVYEEGESLRRLSPEELTKFTNEGAEDFFPATPEGAPFAYKGFHTMDPSSYETSMTVTGAIFEADKVKKIKAISSLCGYPHPDQGRSSREFLYGLIGGGR